jgi:hypothetical protein
MQSVTELRSSRLASVWSRMGKDAVRGKRWKKREDRVIRLVDVRGNGNGCEAVNGEERGRKGERENGRKSDDVGSLSSRERSPDLRRGLAFALGVTSRRRGSRAIKCVPPERVTPTIPCHGPERLNHHPFAFSMRQRAPSSSPFLFLTRYISLHLPRHESEHLHRREEVVEKSLWAPSIKRPAIGSHAVSGTCPLYLA